MALPDLFMFAPDKWESSRVRASLFASVGWQDFSTAPDGFIFHRFSPFLGFCPRFTLGLSFPGQEAILGLLRKDPFFGKTSAFLLGFVYGWDL